MSENSGLEERVRILEEFVDSTYSIEWFREILKNVLFEFGYRSKTNQEPAASFKIMKEELKEIVN